MCFNLLKIKHTVNISGLQINICTGSKIRSVLPTATKN